MTETKIYVGMNDAVTMKQEHATETFSSVLKNVCRSYHVSFSFSLMEGGYVHEDGRYVQENSLVLQLIDADRSVVDEIAKDMCAFFHQESVLITEGEVRAYYVKEQI